MTEEIFDNYRKSRIYYNLKQMALAYLFGGIIGGIGTYFATEKVELAIPGSIVGAFTVSFIDRLTLDNKSHNYAFNRLMDEEPRLLFSAPNLEQEVKERFNEQIDCIE